MSSFINLLDVVYPVGCYYITTNSISPSTLFGGTWSCVNDSFYPEKLVSDNTSVNVGGNYEWNKKMRQNGVGFLSTSSMGQQSIPNGSYKVISTMASTNSYATALRMPCFQHAIGGTQSQWSSWIGSEDSNGQQEYSIYQKGQTTLGYWGIGAVYPLNITGTKSYIWKRTA